MNRFPPPPRGRTPSGHDIPIPESVFGALQSIQQSVNGLAARVEHHQAATDQKLAAVTADVAAVKASSNHATAKMIAALATAVVTVIGGQRALAPAAPAPEVRAVRSAADIALDECRPLQPGSYERAACFERVSRGPGEPR